MTDIVITVFRVIGFILTLGLVLFIGFGYSLKTYTKIKTIRLLKKFYKENETKISNYVKK